MDSAKLNACSLDKTKLQTSGAYTSQHPSWQQHPHQHLVGTQSSELFYVNIELSNWVPNHLGHKNMKLRHINSIIDLDLIYSKT